MTREENPTPRALDPETILAVLDRHGVSFVGIGVHFETTPSRMAAAGSDRRRSVSFSAAPV